MTRGLPRIGDVLFTTEAPLGFAAVLKLEERVALAQRTLCLRPFADLNSDFIAVAIRSPQFQQFLLANATGMTATGIKSARLKLLPFPVPLLAEQKRIVAKVEQLLALCDELETRLKDADARRERLLTAAIHDVLSAAPC